MAATISPHNCEKQKEDESGVRLVTLNLPEDEGEGLGFRLTRTLWDPYPWVREVLGESRADLSGLRAGDCILQADGKDLLGLPVSQVAGLIRGDGSSRGVSLLVWSCGVNPQDDPELLWSAGGGIREERARRAVRGVLAALCCAVCAATAGDGLSCARSHIYCEDCWSRLQRCALCREPLPPKDDPRAKNLVAAQVFEAIAKEYEIKGRLRKTTESKSARTSPRISPHANRKGQYQISMMNRSKKIVQFGNRFHHNYGSDPNLNYPKNEENSQRGNTNTDVNDSCQNCAKCGVRPTNVDTPNLKVNLQHKLIARLRPATSLADLKNTTLDSVLSKSLNCVHIDSSTEKRCCSLDNLKTQCATSTCETPLLLLSAPPIYVLSCDHLSNENNNVIQ